MCGKGIPRNAKYEQHEIFADTFLNPHETPPANGDALVEYLCWKFHNNSDNLPKYEHCTDIYMLVYRTKDYSVYPPRRAVTMRISSYIDGVVYDATVIDLARVAAYVSEIFEYRFLLR